MYYQQKNLFVSGTDGYHTYRIPALVRSNDGTILAFCEGRKFGGGDAGHIDLLLKRSFDDGDTWTDHQVVVYGNGDTSGNPAPVVDQLTGKVWLLFCRNLGDGHESLICQGKAPRTVWLTSSKDDGATWLEPEEITDEVKLANWTWYATGPCHGIQLRSGRLVIPCDHMVGVDLDRKTDPYHSHVLYSDDHGRRWQIGGSAQNGTNECAVVETVDGLLYLNSRNYVGEKCRVGSWSHNQGDSFQEGCWGEELIEPVCQASLIRYTEEISSNRNRILFSNPASMNRERMTIRISYDECQTWSNGKVLHAGPAAYSDLCLDAEQRICCLYERGETDPYETISFDQFDLGWLTGGADRLRP
ncbi:MAG: sialidase family protein [Candidatus Poribacteria bacterium]|nr:sialidase family protein [Candidatus Poribacteria bacterium]